MSVMTLNGGRHRHVGSWATSLVLHGLLGGVIVWFTVLVRPPVMEMPFQWDVALLSAAAPTAVGRTALAPAVKSSVVSPQPPLPASSAAPAPAESVTTPLPPALPVHAAVLNQPVASPSVTEPDVPDSEPVRATSIPSSVASPPVNDVNTGELADQLWRRMEALKRYPYLARRNGWEGKVSIKVVLGGDGRLLHAEIQESSGHEVLDQDALQVLRAATALKVASNAAVAPGCASTASAGCAGAAWQQQATFTLPVAYRLQR